jgi:hypothetical protein
LQHLPVIEATDQAKEGGANQQKDEHLPLTRTPQFDTHRSASFPGEIGLSLTLTATTARDCRYGLFGCN